MTLLKAESFHRNGVGDILARQQIISGISSTSWALGRNSDAARLCCAAVRHFAGRRSAPLLAANNIRALFLSSHVNVASAAVNNITRGAPLA